MFTFALVLATASTIFEMMIAARIPAWRRIASQSILVNLAGSIALSYMMGFLFGAAGLIAMTAGLLSTLMSIPGYKFLHWRFDSPQALANGGDQLNHVRETWTNTKQQWAQPLRDLATLTYKIIRFITLPVRIIRTIVVTLRAWHTRYVQFKLRYTSTS
jgi:hypothetical protein